VTLEGKMDFLRFLLGVIFGFDFVEDSVGVSIAINTIDLDFSLSLV